MYYTTVNIQVLTARVAFWKKRGTNLQNISSLLRHLVRQHRIVRSSSCSLQLLDEATVSSHNMRALANSGPAISCNEEQKLYSLSKYVFS